MRIASKTMIGGVSALILCLSFGQASAFSQLGDATSGIRDSYLEGKTSTTVGEALDAWIACDSVDWQAVTAENGAERVVYSCKHKGVADYVAWMKQEFARRGINNDLLAAGVGSTAVLLAQEPGLLDLTGVETKITFLLNRDGTFDVESALATLTYADGASVDTACEDVSGCLDEIYLNRTSWQTGTIHPMFLMNMTVPNAEYAPHYDPDSLEYAQVLDIMGSFIAANAMTAHGRDAQTDIQALIAAHFSAGQ